jgi:hypothetical protein
VLVLSLSHSALTSVTPSLGHGSFHAVWFSSLWSENPDRESIPQDGKCTLVGAVWKQQHHHRIFSLYQNENLLPETWPQGLTGFVPSSFQICVVIAAVFGIVIYRVVTVSTFAAFKWALIRNNSQVATTGTAVCINFCIIMLLNVVSERQAKWGNSWAAGMLFFCS